MATPSSPSGVKGSNKKAGAVPPSPADGEGGKTHKSKENQYTEWGQSS